MNYRVDTKTQNKLSILGFGCMRFPRVRGRIDIAKSEAMVLDAVARGVNYFDTAYIYPGSEEAVGHIVAKNNLREKIYIATKLPLFMCKTYADFDKYFNTSLARLKTNYIDYYLMHMITSPAQWQTLCGLGVEKWIAEKQAAGQIRQLGFSFHGKREDFTGIIDMRDWDFTMIQYNYLDINNQAGRSGLQYAASKNIPVFIMEPLLGGRLARTKTMPEKVRNLLTNNGQSLSVTTTSSPSSSSTNSSSTTSSPTTPPTIPLTPASRALRWIWNHEEVTLLLSGMTTQKELDENIAAAASMTAPNILSPSETKIIDDATAAFRESNKINCTGCGYCMPCPRGVNISDSFSCYNTSYAASLFVGLKTYVQATGALSSKRALASSCNNCGVCEPLCPQNIPIRQSLKTVRKRLEPFWAKWILAVARIFTGIKTARSKSAG